MAAAAPRLRLATREAWLGVALIAPCVIVFAAVIVYPLVSAVILSLSSVYTPTLHGHWVGLGNYAALLRGRDFWHGLLATAIWTAGTLAVQFTLGITVALLLNENIVFRSLARALVLFPYFVSTVVAVLVWRWLFNDLYGILNHLMIGVGLFERPIDWLGMMPNAMISIIVVGGWKYFPFVVITVLARLQTIPAQLYEAATIDGAGRVARFFDVTLPQLREVLLIVLLLRAIWDFKEFDLLYLLTGGGPVDATQTLPLLVYQQAFALNDMGRASAVAVLMFLVLLVFMALYGRARRSEA